MIDFRKEQVLSLAAAAKLPCFQNRRCGRPIAVATLWKWSTTGCRGVRLETVMVGGSRATSLEAIGRFVEALTLQANSKRAKPTRGKGARR